MNSSRHPMLHPRARMLQRFADGELAAERRSRLTAHLSRCSRCRAQVRFARATAAAARSLRAPAATDALLERVLADRAAGSRVILPAMEPHRGRRLMRRAAAGAALAASVIVAFTLAAHVRTVRPGLAGDAPTDSIPMLESVMTSIGVLPENAYGQEPPNASRGAPITGVDGRAITPVALSYEFTVSADSEQLEKPEGGSTTIARAVFRGRQAWRVTNQWLGHATDIAETTYVDRETLRPFARVAHNVGTSHFTVEQRFVGDSLLGTMRTLQRNRALERELPPEATVGPWLVGEGMPVALLLAVKLKPGWRGGAVVVGFGAARSDLVYPITLAVDGEERITVPAGTFDCWRLSLLAGRRRQTLWVRKSDQLTVMSRISQPSGQLRQVVLTSARPIAT